MMKHVYMKDVKVRVAWGRRGGAALGGAGRKERRQRAWRCLAELPLGKAGAIATELATVTMGQDGAMPD